MSEISKKVAYIKGMAEGMELTADTAKDAKDKLLLQMLDALDLIAEELDSIRDRQDEAERYIDELDSDLGELEEAVFEEEDEDDSLDFIEYECPHCGASVYYDQSAFDLSEEHPCPSCGKELFPETPDEDE